MLRRPRPTIALMVSASRMNGKRELHVGDPHDDRRGPALDEAGEQAEQPADHRGHHHRAHADEEREARAVEHPRQEIAAELIGAERMAGRARRLEARREVRRERIVRRQPRRERRDDQHGRVSDEAQPLLHEPGSFTSAYADARVEPAVGEIDRQVHQRVDDRRERHGRQHHREVAVEQRLHGEPAEPGPREDRLGDHGAAQELAGLEPGQGHDRDRGVAQRVLADHPALARGPWRARSGCTPRPGPRAPPSA